MEDNAANSVLGHVGDGFAPVRDTFLQNYHAFDERGSAVCVYLDGKPVIDLVGGWKDVNRQSQWTQDTIVNIWSATKGVVAICFAMAVDAKLASYDDLVLKYWPEFAVKGKDQITIKVLLSHQAGLAAFDTPATLEDLLAGEPMADRLAAQAPLWTPGSASGYHMMTYGNIVSALFRRIEGRSIKQFIQEEFAEKRGLNIHIGLPSRFEEHAAEIALSDSIDLSFRDNVSELQEMVFTRPHIEPLVCNEEIWKDADLPSANGFSNASALAKLYAALIDEDAPLVGADTLAHATRPLFEGEDLILKIHARWGCGFVLNTDDGLYGPNFGAFGHTGWGGSCGFTDPEAGVAMSYTPNNMGYKLRNDPRAKALIDTVYRCLS